MNNTNNNYCVILAGGKGRRLWPCSRESKPKQFIDFFGSGRTQLQQTYDRFKEIVPVENIYVNTNDAYIDLVLEQLPDLAPDHLLAEPIHRGTAPSVAWCAHRIIAHNPDANIVIAPSDQTIIGEDTQRRLNRAMDRLPSTQRRMLLLRSEGKSLDEIAEICGANKTSTKTMISAARRSLLKMIKS